MDAWSFPDVLTATGWGRDGHPWSLPVCVCVYVCVCVSHEANHACWSCSFLPLPTMSHLPAFPHGSLLPWSLPVCVCMGWSFSRLPFQAETERGIGVSESEISAVFATVHNSINVDEVKRRSGLSLLLNCGVPYIFWIQLLY